MQYVAHRLDELANQSHQDDVQLQCHRCELGEVQDVAFLMSTRVQNHRDVSVVLYWAPGAVGVEDARIPSTCRNRHMPHRH